MYNLPISYCIFSYTFISRGSLFSSFTLVDEVDNDRVRTGRPRILLVGKRRSGKTSIAGVLFKRISPHETLFLHSTTYIEHHQGSNIHLYIYKESNYLNVI